MSVKTHVWDVAVRFFHWSQVLLLGGLWYTGNEGLMAQHQLMAYTLAALLIARICWGLYGSTTARFRHFAASPIAALRYLRHPKPVLGHNPAGAYMIFALILLLALQLLTGLATFDNSYISDGPLVQYLAAEWVSLASSIHKVNIDIILICVGVHVIAALWHSWRYDNVLLTMITGKTTQQYTSSMRPLIKASWSYFVIVVVLLGVFYVWQGEMLVKFI
ncbi:cytochrome b/b6 domain-containing protein [Alishewanella tabrizica]|uniref:Hydrogenase n=1 Tax=Alishewanella tabrizica TaxID=671278 RepID=A0ABQ2WSG8_9ALTE|nr:cytochrome b/b6 domain-containing protein [Alishewanella tabrizica]GGW71534.1 hydrogenase [Alishewanella tabrizica]